MCRKVPDFRTDRGGCYRTQLRNSRRLPPLVPQGTIDTLAWAIRYNAWMLSAILLLPLLTQQQEEPPAKTVEVLIEMLGAHSIEARDNAMQELKAIGKSATAQLEQASRSRDLEVAFRARYVLRSFQKKGSAAQAVITVEPHLVRPANRIKITIARYYRVPGSR